MAKDSDSKKLADAQAELETLKRRIKVLEAQLEASTDGDDEERDPTRRGVVGAAWVAPVVMAVNSPDKVFAQFSPGRRPTRRPTIRPTVRPTI